MVCSAREIALVDVETRWHKILCVFAGSSARVCVCVCVLVCVWCHSRFQVVRAVSAVLENSIINKVLTAFNSLTKYAERLQHIQQLSNIGIQESNPRV